jgi:predicted lipase
MNYKYLTILILIIIIIILIISFGVIFFIKKTKEKYDKISNFENFQTFLNITNDCYYYTSELDFENNTFKKDSSGNFVNTGGDDVNINNILRNNYFNRLIEYTKKKHNLEDFELLYGNQQNLNLTYKTGIFGFIAKTNGEGLICLRGTANFRDWLTDVNIGSKNITDIKEFQNIGIPSSFKVYKGFALLYGIERPVNSKNPKGLCMSKQIFDWVNRHNEINNYKVCGHSLGASLASIASYQLLKVHNKKIQTFLFASPRTFSREIVSDLENNFLNKLENNIYNFYNTQDLIHSAILSVIDLDSTIIGFDIPFSGNSGCFQHIGKQLSIDYIDSMWPRNEQFITNVHSLQEGYIDIINVWKERIFNNKVFFINNPKDSDDNKLNNIVTSKPDINKFKIYSSILNNFYNNINLISKSFYQFLGVPSIFTTELNKCTRSFGITNAHILYVSDINILTPNISYPNGFIGIYKGKGIIVLGMDYDNFPDNLSYNDALPSFLKAVSFTEIKDKLGNPILGNCKIVEEYRKLYFNSCTRSFCISNGISDWLKLNKSINEFIIIGQNAGSCFGILAALDLYSKGKIINDIYLYGSPKIGDLDFVKNYNNILGNKTYVFLNNQDPFVTLLPYISNIYGRIISSKPFDIFGHVGQIYNSDAVPDGSVCEFKYFDYIRNPRAYFNVSDWDKVLS